MLDPSIIANGALNAQAIQQNNMQQIGNTADAFQKLVLSRKIHEMNQLDTDEAQKSYALKSKLFAPLLMQSYNENQQAKAKAIKDQILTDASLGKTYAETTDLLSGAKKKDSEAGKINTESTGLNIDQDGKLNSMVWGSILNGGKNAGLAQLEMQKGRGLIDEAAYNQRLGLINDLPTDPEQAQKYAFAMYKGIQDPKYNLVTSDNQLDNNTSLANNQLDNTTSADNNIRTNQTRVQTTGMNNQTSLGVAQIGATSAQTVAGINQEGQNYRTEKEIEYKRQQDAIQSKQGEYKSWNGQVYFVDKSGAVFDAVDAQGNPILDPSNSGGGTGTGGGTPTGGKGLTESQAKDNLFAGRMLAANGILSNFESQGVTSAVLSKIPLIGESYAQNMPSWLGGSSQTQLQYDQAKRDFVNAVLRKESGAVIGVDEFKNAEKQYFPQVGDGAGVIKQKAENRQRAIDLINQGLPRGYQQAPASQQPTQPTGKARRPIATYGL